MTLATNTNKSVDLIIHDPAGTFFAWVWVPLFAFIPLSSLFNGDFINFLLSAILCFPLAYYFFLVAKTKTEGVKVSIERNTITYPGGDIAAESMFSYFTPSFWLQCTKLHTTAFEDITQLQFTTDRTILNKISEFLNNSSSSAKYTEPKYRYGVCIDGAFGAANIYFRNRQKASQLFGVLRQHLKAGVPVLDASA
jgi:hypothetical protein